MSCVHSAHPIALGCRVRVKGQQEAPEDRSKPGNTPAYLARGLGAGNVEEIEDFNDDPQRKDPF